MRISDWSSDVCSSDLRDQHRSRFRWRKHEIGSAEILVVEGDFLQQRPAGDNPVPAIAWRKEEWRRLSMKRLHVFERILDKSGIVDERSEEHTSELQSLMRISYAVFCLKKKKTQENKLRKENINRYNK